MDKLVIEGGTKLSGRIKASVTKNSALPLLFATLLTKEECVLDRIPVLADIETTLKLLQQVGAKTHFDRDKKRVLVQTASLLSNEAPYDLVRTMRASVLILGPMLAHYGKAKVSLPGGCSIGARPVNLHLMALEKMGAKISLDEGYIFAESKKLKGAEIYFDQVSVGATENTMMAATLANGKTILRNAAQEPEIVDLTNLLKKMGAKISGEGSSTIEIEGVEKLHGTTHSTIADRIETGTYLVAAAMTGGSIQVDDVEPNLLQAVLDKLTEMGAKIETSAHSIKVTAEKPLRSVNISTTPFPGFPTDMQAQFMALQCISEGTSILSENIFENRFMHVPELVRLGADIAIQNNTAVVKGFGGTEKTLKGATVMATDLRASACLVLAGLVASGKTTVRRIYHLDRGYERMEEKLKTLGAKIVREKELE